MSSLAVGFPDWQRITQWFGTPVEQATAYPIGAAAKVIGPLNVRNFASIVVCVAPHGGNVTVTVDQQVPGGPVGLKTSSSFVVNAGNAVFEAFVLLAGVATVTLQGTAGGETLDYAIVPSNTNVNAEVAALTQLGFQHNDVVVASETAIDLEDTTSLTWALVDDPANLRVKVSPTVLLPAGTSFPAGPVDGQRYAYVADATNGVFWEYRYYAAGGYWAFVGGPPLWSEVATAESCTSNVYADLATVGPAIALPFAADYDVTLGYAASVSNDFGVTTSMSYAIGGTAAVDADRVVTEADTTVVFALAAQMRPRRKTGLGAVTLTAKYKCSTVGGTTILNRWMSVRPVKK